MSCEEYDVKTVAYRMRKRPSQKLEGFAMKSTCKKKRIEKKSLLILMGAILLVSMTGCASSPQAATSSEADSTDAKVSGISLIINNPDYTDIAFGTLKDDLFSKKGEPDNTYPSSYEGETYQYDNQEYEGYKGSAKYMTDAEGRVACMAWMYVADDANDVKLAYEKLHGKLIEKYGKGDNESTQEFNADDIWYMDDVHVQISAVTTSDFCGLQISYLDANYSLKDMVDAKRAAREAEKP